jgi:lysozyme
MTDPRKPAFDAARRVAGSLTERDVDMLHAALDAIRFYRGPDEVVATAVNDLTPRIVAYVASEEGLVREAYKDSSNVWTWALGVTNMSGHEVYPRYKDSPQSIERCIEVSVWLMRNHYLPAVLDAFKGASLTEAQLAAALSFHWNTGAIKRTDWVRMWRSGDATGARKFLVSHYLNGGVLKKRREKEAALFFSGVWPADMRVPVYPVRKPSYQPDFRRGEMIDIVPLIKGIV